MPKKDTKLKQLSDIIHITVEDIRESGIEGLDLLFMECYMEQAEMLSDSRQQEKVKHSLKDIVGIVFFAVLAGNDEWTDIYDFAIDEREILKKYLELKNGIPSHDTLQRVFCIIKSDELQSMLVNVLVEIVEKARKELGEYLYKNDELNCYVRDVIAADGKETHNTAKKNSVKDEDRKNLQEFNVVSTEWGICLSSTKIDEKSNEIPEMQKVIKGIDCKNCIVTTDAMNAQKETARAIVREGHGDYCLALKGNQKNAHSEVVEYFACEEILNEIKQKQGQYRKEVESTTYAVIDREYYITDDIKWFEDLPEWEKLTSIGYEKKTITNKETGEKKVEERYYLCSIKAIAELFSIVVRRHWNIENNLHWTLDVVFREDKLQSKEKKGIHNLGLVRRFVMFIIKLLKAYYGRSMKRIRHKIGRRPESELPVVLAVLKVLYDNNKLDAIDELTK